MIVNLPSDFPAITALRAEGIDLADCRQSQRGGAPLRIAILNLMPLKQMTEVDLLRILSASPLDIEVYWLKLDSHVSRNTPHEHMARYYRSFADVAGDRFDGLIVTGAPVEKLDYEAVDYWDELCRVFDWSRTHVTGSSLFICWGALAALYYFYGVPKYILSRKISGVFPHVVVDRDNPLLRGFDDRYYVPHSRYGDVRADDIVRVPELTIVSTGENGGVYIVQDVTRRQIFVTGHSEYAPMTLDFEYHRDLDKGMSPDIPANYYPDNDPSQPPCVLWRSHAHLLFCNWLQSLA